MSPEPRCLQMEEPFGALDLQTRELMKVELMRLWELDRKTVLFVTHSVDEAVLLSDRIVVLSARPARVLQVVDVRLPRPRRTGAGELVAPPAFAECRRCVRELLRREQPEPALVGAA